MLWRTNWVFWPVALATTFARAAFSAHGVALIRILAWLVALGFVYRVHGAEALALLGLVKGLTGLLNYCTVGLGAGMLRLASHGRRSDLPGVAVSMRVIARQGIGLSVMLAGTGMLILIFVVVTTHGTRPGMRLALLLGLSTAIRAAGESVGAILFARHRIATEFFLQWLAEFVFLVGMLLTCWWGIDWQIVVGGAVLLGGVVAMVFRIRVARGILRDEAVEDETVEDETVEVGAAKSVVPALLAFGFFVLVGQMSDFMYGPSSQLILRKQVGTAMEAAYVQAIQFDACLLMLVSGFAARLLPTTMALVASGEGAAIRRHYLKNTIVCSGVLLIGSILAYALSPWVFKAWLGRDVSETRAILPWVLSATVIGGTAALGRSVMFAIGQARQYAVGALIAGLINVAVALVLVRVYGLGVMGVLYATIGVAALRCVVWMPWQILRSLH